MARILAHKKARDRWDRQTGDRRDARKGTSRQLADRCFFSDYEQSGRKLVLNMRDKAHCMNLHRCQKISVAGCFQRESKRRSSRTFSEQNNCRNLVRRANVFGCRRVFSSARASFIVHVCVYALSNSRAFACHAQPTDSCAFPTRAFVGARSHYFM